MILAFVGTPGSGKSYEAVKKLLDNVAIGRIVYTNIDGLGESHCIEYQKLYLKMSDYEFHGKINYLSNEQMLHFWDYVPAGCLVVLDEAHTLFSNRDWSSDSNKGFSNWATHHRHQGSDCILVTHSIEKIDKHVRSCIEWTFLFKKIEFLGSMVRNSYLWYAYFGDDMTVKCIKWGRRSYDKFIFNCYRSYFGKDVKELKIMPMANVFKHPVFFILPVVLLFSLYMLFFKSSFMKGNIFSVDTNKITAAGKIGEQINLKSIPVSSKSGGVDRNEKLKSHSFKEYDNLAVPLSSFESKKGDSSAEKSCRVVASAEFDDYIMQTINCDGLRSTKRIEKDLSLQEYKPSPSHVEVPALSGTESLRAGSGT